MWVKLDDHFVDHPKIVKAGPMAGWLFVAGLCYANRFLTNGFIPAEQVGRLLPRVPRLLPTELAGKLCRSRLWKTAKVKGTKGYIVHDFLKYQPSRRQVIRERKKTAERQARWRGNGNGH